MMIGSLRRQLLYPSIETDVPNATLLNLLRSVNLPDLAERFGGLDVELDWGKVLSIGEQQRLAFARVFLAKPRYAILDEATSALDTRNEEHLYQQLRSTSTTVVSVSHHSTIVKFHDQVLQLTGDGKWQLGSAHEYSTGR